MTTQQTSPSPLSLFIIFSLGFHIIVLSLFTLFSPKIIVEKSVQILIQMNQASSQSSINSTPLTPLPKTPTPKKTTATKPTPKEISQPKIQEKKSIPKPQIKESDIPIKESPSQTTTPTPAVAQKTPPTNIPQESIPPQPIIKEETPVEKQETPSDILSQELEQLLSQKPNSLPSNDALADASWSGAPRKTLSFPDITANIPEHYKSRGYGFSVTAKITFTPQGWVSAIDLLRTSGDPRIDNIFHSELRKIRIEPSQKTSLDVIIKTFTISVK